MTEPCHQIAAGAGCTLSSPRNDSMFLFVDTGCNLTMLPYAFKKFEVKDGVRGSVRCTGARDQVETTIELAGKGHVLKVGRRTEVLLPVRDVNGELRFSKEECCFTDSTRYPLLGCMKRPSSLSMPDHLETVECVDEMGSKFWAKVDRLHNDIPVVCVVDSNADAKF